MFAFKAVAKKMLFNFDAEQNSLMKTGLKSAV